MSNLAEARSPFALLDEVDQAKEVLVLSYTANLDFFERFSLSHARALGAVVSVVADAGMISADPVVVRRAGTAYLDARASCAGAFHPKLLVIAGRDEARVALGSGNLTMAGWHGNAEIWTVLRSDPDSPGPQTIHQVADFLDALGQSDVKLSPGAGPALERVSGYLREVPVAESGPQLLHNLRTPISEQLPEGPVQELGCCAPFYDPALSALRQLVDRLKPGRLSIHIQPETSVDGPTLEAFHQEHQADLRWIKDRRYHHGKLIEWLDDGQRLALTGSPNLSVSALGSTAGTGNTELALLSEVPVSSLPVEGPAPSKKVTELTIARDRGDAAPGLLLLGAFATSEGTRLLLDAPLIGPGIVQGYDRVADGWTKVASISPGEETYDLDPFVAPAGRALRIVLDDNTTSNQVFVADLDRVRRPQATAVGSVRKSPTDIAADGLGDLLLADLDELRAHLLRVGALVVRTPTEQKPEPDEGDGGDQLPRARPAPGQTLEDFVNACDPVLGREMTEFALVLPALPGVGISVDEEEEPEIEDGKGPPEEPPVKPEEPPGLTDTIKSLPASDKDRYRNFVLRFVDRSPGYPLVLRTLALRTIFHAIDAGLWTESDWPELLAKAARALTAESDEPTDQEREAAASMAAIALALERSSVPRMSVLDEANLRFRDLAKELTPLLAHVDSTRLELVAPDLPEPLKGTAGVAATTRVVDEVLKPVEGVTQAVRLLAEDYDTPAEAVSDNMLRFLDPLPGHFEPQVFRALGLAQVDGPIAAVGRTEEDVEVVAVWSAPELVVERRKDGRSWGRAYSLPGRLTPINYTGLEERPPGHGSWMKEAERPEPAAALLNWSHQR